MVPAGPEAPRDDMEARLRAAAAAQAAQPSSASTGGFAGLGGRLRAGAAAQAAQQAQPALAAAPGQAAAGQVAGPQMPEGIDPRLAAIYTQFGKTPTERGTGLTDWQYWQKDAVTNAGGDWDYVLGRLKEDFEGTGRDSDNPGGPGRSAAAPGQTGAVPGQGAAAAVLNPSSAVAAGQYDKQLSGGGSNAESNGLWKTLLAKLQSPDGLALRKLLGSDGGR